MDLYEKPVSFDKEISAQWKKYYSDQSGSGLVAYHGDELQKGRGIFGTLFKRIALPVAKYLGRKGAAALLSAGTDALGGENFVESIKKHGKDTMRGIASDVADRATLYAQTGKGRRKRRRKQVKRKKTKSRAGKKKKNKKTEIHRKKKTISHKLLF